MYSVVMVVAMAGAPEAPACCPTFHCPKICLPKFHCPTFHMPKICCKPVCHTPCPPPCAPACDTHCAPKHHSGFLNKCFSFCGKHGGWGGHGHADHGDGSVDHGHHGPVAPGCGQVVIPPAPGTIIVPPTGTPVPEMKKEMPKTGPAPTKIG